MTKKGEKGGGSCSSSSRMPTLSRMPSSPWQVVADDNANLVGLLLSTPMSVPYDILQDEIKKSTGMDLSLFTIRRLRRINEDDKMAMALLLRREAIKDEMNIQLYAEMLDELREEIARADDATFNKDKYNLQVTIIDKIVKILEAKVGRYERRYKEARAEAETPRQIASYSIPCEPKAESTPAEEQPPEIGQESY